MSCRIVASAGAASAPSMACGRRPGTAPQGFARVSHPPAPLRLHQSLPSSSPRVVATRAAAEDPSGAPSPRPSYVDVDSLGERLLDWSPDSIDEADLVSGGALDSTLLSLTEDIRNNSDDILEMTTGMLTKLGIPVAYPAGDPARGIFCSRTINLKAVKALGYDMDYTLVHYNVEKWEGTAYKYGLDNLRRKGLPVEGLKFDPYMVIRGLIVDKNTGNVVKADRFGYVKRAMHGTRMMTFREMHQTYGRELIDLRKDDRWEFINTFFSVSQALMYMQMVDAMDEGQITAAEVDNAGYKGLYNVVSAAAFRTHVEGKLKADVMRDPGQFVEPDSEIVDALLDQKAAGKLLILITNSDFEYTDRMMSHAYDPFLPVGVKWRDVFDMVILSAQKPAFFGSGGAMYEVVTDDGLMQPCFNAKRGGMYCGGSAKQVERALGVTGDDIMYVGDHIYTDVSIAKISLRWRTCLIVRELEREVEALRSGKPHRKTLKDLMNKKECVGDVFNQIRLAMGRTRADREPQVAGLELDERECEKVMLRLHAIQEKLDEEISVMLATDGSDFNERWGYLSIAGLNDKSHLTRQIEKYADIYTSRVSNFLRYTPYMYFRSPSQSLAHDRKKSPSWKSVETQQVKTLRREIRRTAEKVGEENLGMDEGVYEWALESSSSPSATEKDWPQIQAKWNKKRGKWGAVGAAGKKDKGDKGGKAKKAE